MCPIWAQMSIVVPIMGADFWCDSAHNGRMANNLRGLRDGRSWSQDEAAAALGTTRNQYAKLEGGSRRLSDKWIRRAADAYGVDPGDIVTDRPGTVPLA